MNIFKHRKFCAACHGTQMYGNTQTDDGGMDGFHLYPVHLDEVEAVMVRFGFRFCFGLRKSAHSHDIFEDTDATPESARAAGMGEYELGLSWACTDGIAETRHARKAEAFRKILLTEDAIITKLADRIGNVEHSIKTGNERKYWLYVDEMTEFVAALRNAPHQKRYAKRVARMWKHLEWLLTEEGRLSNWKTANCCGNYHRAVAA